MKARKAKLAAQLDAWFAQNAREMPWRKRPTPYRVWVSEIMLQQTQVATVIPYFERFMARFPDLHSLASAREDDVLAVWSGLGYYRRARMLHAAARQIVDDHGGSFPTSRAAVLELPGVGPYTAGAILSIAFNDPEPIVDGNVERVFARLTRYRTDIKTAAGQRAVWKWAKAAVHEAAAQGVSPSVFNQALMELGATVCAPLDARCIQCPACNLCEARKQGDQRQLPKLPPRKAAQEVAYFAVVVKNKEGQVLLVRRHGGSLLPDDLWELPHGLKSDLPISDALANATAIRVQAPVAVGVVTHSIVKYRLTVTLYAGKFKDFGAKWAPGNVHSEKPSSATTAVARTVEARWFKPNELKGLPMASITRKLLRLAKLLA